MNVFRSLRFQLPAIFLLGILLAGLVAAVAAFQLFQRHSRNESFAELRREAAGIASIYAEYSRLVQVEEEAQTPPFLARELERATGDRLFYVGLPFVPGEDPGLRRLPGRAVDWGEGKVVEFELVPPRERRTFLAVAHPLRPDPNAPPFGAIVLATPKDELSDELATLMERLALASLVGFAIAGVLGWYLSRRITRPVLQLSRAADEVAEGRYGVALPAVAGGEVAQLAERFREMAARLAETEERERNFLMSVSHELRTPLTAIRGHVAALREGLAEQPEARDASLAIIDAETERLSRLVGDVLDLAKLDANRFTVLQEEVDMDRLTERAYAAFGEEARSRGIEYRRAAHARPVIITDGDRVLQIISNLLSNAFRWTPDGGRVELALTSENGAVSVDVSDTGPGIAADDRERIFRPFWSLDQAGTGLGLPIARELALALGGRIELDTDPGKGSRFRLVLPATPAAPTAQSAPPTPSRG